MGRVDSPIWTRLKLAKFKWITFSFFVGFGLAGCSGGESPEEPVAAEEGAAATGDDVVIEDAPGTEAPVAEPEEEGLEGEVAEEDLDEPSAPPEVMDTASDSVNAELAADPAPSEPPPSLGDSMEGDAGVAENEAAADAEPMFNEPAPAPQAAVASAPSSVIPMGTVSSPGAAANLPSAPSSSQSYTASASSAGSDQSIYVVRSGDTLAEIAGRIYGNVMQWQSMAAANGLSAPYRIFPGDEIKYDLSSNKAKQFAQKYAHSRKHVTVKKGDTLSTLADEIYGSPYAWKMFLSYNKDKISNPHRIPAGIKLAYVDLGGHQTYSAKPKKKETVVAAPEAEPKPAAAVPAEVETEDAAPIAADAAPAAAAVQTAAPVEEEVVDDAPAAVEVEDEPVMEAEPSEEE